jgi:hypothetical protein
MGSEMILFEVFVIRYVIDSQYDKDNWGIGEWICLIQYKSLNSIRYSKN